MTTPAASTPAAAPTAPERDALERWIAGRDLARVEMESLFGRLMDGAISPVYQAALLVALAAKGETVGEIAGAAAAMRGARDPHPAPSRPTWSTPAAPAATARGTFNISTAAALVAAAAGVPVAKHGNRSVSRRCG